MQNGVYVLPNDVALHHYLARIYIEDKRYDIAIDELEKVLDLSPKNYDANWDLGMVFFEMGDWHSAIANFERVQEFVETNVLVYYYTAMAYEANNEINKAISNYLKALSVNSQFHIAYKKLAVLFFARGDKEDALEYINDYLEFDLPEEEKEQAKNLLAKFSS